MLAVPAGPLQPGNRLASHSDHQLQPPLRPSSRRAQPVRRARPASCGRGSPARPVVEVPERDRVDELAGCRLAAAASGDARRRPACRRRRIDRRTAAPGSPAPGPAFAQCRGGVDVELAGSSSPSRVQVARRACRRRSSARLPRRTRARTPSIDCAQRHVRRHRVAAELLDQARVRAWRPHRARRACERPAPSAPSP